MMRYFNGTLSIYTSGKRVRSDPQISRESSGALMVPETVVGNPCPRRKNRNEQEKVVSFNFHYLN